MFQVSSFLRHVDALNTHDLNAFVPFVVSGVHVGWIAHHFIPFLKPYRDVFIISDFAVALADQHTSPHARTIAITSAIDDLIAQELLPEKRHEDYTVAKGWGLPPLMTIDRAIAPYFGIKCYGVHMNGIVPQQNGLPKMWIGTRSPHKAVAPGKLDNMVAGGQPAGLSLKENLIKECAEEANIPHTLASTAKPTGLVSYCRNVQNTLKCDTLFCYDLIVPDDFIPENQDGEMVSFALMDISEVLHRVANSNDFKENVNLVILDFAIRHGFLNGDTLPGYEVLASALRRGPQTPRL